MWLQWRLQNARKEVTRMQRVGTVAQQWAFKRWGQRIWSTPEERERASNKAEDASSRAWSLTHAEWGSKGAEVKEKLAAEAAAARKEQSYWLQQAKRKDRAPAARVAAATRGRKASGGVVNRLRKVVRLRDAIQALHRTKLLGRAQKSLRIQKAKKARLKAKARECRMQRQADEDQKAEEAAEYPEILAAKRKAAAAIGELCRKPAVQQCATQKRLQRIRVDELKADRRLRDTARVNRLQLKQFHACIVEIEEAASREQGAMAEMAASSGGYNTPERR